MEENRRLRERFSDGTPGQVRTAANHNNTHTGEDSNEVHAGADHNEIPPEHTISGEQPTHTTPAEPIRHESDDLIETPASVGSTTYHGTYARVQIP
jgi:hypothetical protein